MLTRGSAGHPQVLHSLHKISVTNFFLCDRKFTSKCIVKERGATQANFNLRQKCPAKTKGTGSDVSAKSANTVLLCFSYGGCCYCCSCSCCCCWQLQFSCSWYCYWSLSLSLSLSLTLSSLSFPSRIAFHRFLQLLAWAEEDRWATGLPRLASWPTKEPVWVFVTTMAKRHWSTVQIRSTEQESSSLLTMPGNCSITLVWLHHNWLDLVFDCVSLWLCWKFAWHKSNPS